MKPEDLLSLLFVAANAKTDEEKARVAWRASDHMWREFPRYSLGLCREFNNLCQDQNQEWPIVKNLWSKEEVKEARERFGIKT